MGKQDQPKSGFGMPAAGLPANLDCERYALGAALSDPDQIPILLEHLKRDDFFLEKHRRIFQCVIDLRERNEVIDRVTIANELTARKQLESVDGLTYLVSLDEGLPAIPNIAGYIGIVLEMSRLRRVIYQSQQAIDRCLALDKSQDIISQAQTGLLDFAAPGGSAAANATEIIGSIEGGINTFLNPSHTPKGVLTGFHKLDEMTGGFRPGELIVIAARPAAGKSALASNISLFVALNKNLPVVIFSLEMSQASLLERMTCCRALVDLQKFRLGYLNQNERNRLQKAVHELTKAPLRIDDRSGINLAGIHNQARRLKREEGLALVVVDYLQLMASTGPSDNRNVEVGRMSRGLKVMSGDLGIPVIALSQLNRQPEKRGDNRPLISDTRESGNIEADADIMLLIFREEMYRQVSDENRGKAELIIGKQRNGPTGTVYLKWQSQFTRFHDPDLDLEAEAHQMHL